MSDPTPNDIMPNDSTQNYHPTPRPGNPIPGMPITDNPVPVPPDPGVVLLKSRKFWYTAIGALIVLVGKRVGLDSDTLLKITISVGNLTLSQAIADAGGKPKEAFYRSRKFWYTLIGDALVSVARSLGIDEDTATKMWLAIQTLVFGQGIADAGKARISNTTQKN